MSIRFRIFLSLSLLYAALIFYLSSIPSPGNTDSTIQLLKPISRTIEISGLEFLAYPLYILDIYSKSIVHIVLYAGFGFLLYFTFKNSSIQILNKDAEQFAILIGAAYGVTDEIHQFFVPGRIMSIWDLVAACIGLASAQAIILIKNKVSGKKIMSSTFDLKLVLVLMILSIVFILIPPYNRIDLRILFALAFLLFPSGYLFITAMFPRKEELSPIERFTLSIGLSIVIFIFDGFALNYTPWGFRPVPIVISLSLIIALLLAASYFQRMRLREKAYYFSIEHIVSFYRTLKGKETVNFCEYNHSLEKMFIRTMIIAIVVVSAMLIYAKVTTEPEKFTSLYILGEDGKAENYPSELYIGEPARILVGLENHEYMTVNYTLRVNLAGNILKEQEILLDHNYRWLNNVTFVPELTSSIALAGANRSKLEFQILKDNRPYRSVHLLVNTIVDPGKFAALPIVINGDMELDGGWEFSRNNMNITGRYSKEGDFLSSRSFEMHFASEKAETYGNLYQNISTQGEALATLSFDVKDTDMTNTSSYVFKQALIDDQVVWESGAGGKNGAWTHVETPVMISGKNILAFRVYSKYDINYNGTFWWDNVQLKSYEIPLQQSELDVKFLGFYNDNNVTKIKLSVENLGKKAKSFDLKPAPVLTDELGKKYNTVKIDSGSEISQNTIYPGVVREGNIFFKEVNSSARNLTMILHINGKKYDFFFKAEPGIPEEVKEADIGETINNSGFEVGIYGFLNTQDFNSRVIIAVKNKDDEEKPIKLSPASVLVDDLGNQYDRVKVQKGSEIEQTTIYPGVVRKGSIYFSEVNPAAKRLTLLLFLNGEKYVFNFKADPKILQEDYLFKNTSINMTADALFGETISRGGYEVSLRGFQNIPEWASKIVISGKNIDVEEKLFKLNPAPVLIDDLGNQYEMISFQRGLQIRQTVVYPGFIRTGNVFFKDIDPGARYLWLIMYLNGERFIFGFKPELKILESEIVPPDPIKIAVDGTMGESIARNGFEVTLKGFQNDPDWTSRVIINIRNLENQNEIFKLNTSTVLIDDLGNQYEMVDINRVDQIEQTVMAPGAQKEGFIIFEPVKTEAKYIRLILSIPSGKYVFGFEPFHS